MLTKPYLMYHELAPWFHLLTDPAEYKEEAEFIAKWVLDWRPLSKKILELGSGGGNLASHLRNRFSMTLVDLSPEMQELSKTINPEIVHLIGDMRSFRMAEQFDVVLIHDAIDYMTSLKDLQQTMDTCYAHCRPGGMAVFSPDWTSEEFHIEVSHGGKETPDGNGLYYLEWVHPPTDDPHQYLVDYAYLVRGPDGETRSFFESHRVGLFSTDEWLTTIRNAGFEPGVLPDPTGHKYLYGLKLNNNKK